MKKPKMYTNSSEYITSINIIFVVCWYGRQGKDKTQAYNVTDSKFLFQ